MQEFTLKRILGGVLGIILLVFLFAFSGGAYEQNDAGEIVIIQDPFDGELHVYTQPGYQPQFWGKATHYKKSNQFWFSFTEQDSSKAIAVKWNDGGHAVISGSIRYDLPTDEATLIHIQSTFGSQEAIENSLIKTNIEKAIYMVGPLMSSKEAYAEKKNDLIFYIEDQASKGVYKTKQINIKIKDELTGEEKMTTKVEICQDSSGKAIRQEESPIAKYGVNLYNISINNMLFDATVEAQIRTQQQSIMSVQTAIANAKRAEQDAITTAKQGEANAASAKWEQEVIKAKLVTQAEANKQVAALEVQTAALNKQKQILEGEGEAAKKRLVMQANGALEQKLDAWVRSQQYWAEALGKYQGNISPLYYNGNGLTGNAALSFMEIMSAKAAKDLTLDLKNK